MFNNIDASGVSSGDARQSRASGPRANQQRIKQSKVIASLSPSGTGIISGNITLRFTVTSPSAKLATLVSIGFAENGGSGAIILPALPGVWSLTPYINSDDGRSYAQQPIFTDEAIPDGYEVATMADFLVANVTIYRGNFTQTALPGWPRISVIAGATWESIAGGDNCELSDFFSGCNLHTPPVVNYLYTSDVS